MGEIDGKEEALSLYHGTLARNRENIESRGLLPRKLCPRPPKGEKRSLFRCDPDAVFMAYDPDVAFHFARIQRDYQPNVPRDMPILIYRARIPKYCVVEDDEKEPAAVKVYCDGKPIWPNARCIADEKAYGKSAGDPSKPLKFLPICKEWTPLSRKKR